MAGLSACPAAAQVTIFLDYGTSGNAANDFVARLNELTALGGYAPPASDEILTLKAAIKTGLQDAYQPLSIVFVENQPATGEFERLEFGRRPEDVPGSRPGAGGDFDTLTGMADWLNLDRNDSGHIYPINFFRPVVPLPPRAQAIALVTAAMTKTAVHEIGHGFGLQHHDSFGDPSILPTTLVPVTYANTGDVEYDEFMSVSPNGEEEDYEVSLAHPGPYHFSQLSKAKLEFARGLTATPPPLTSETIASHDSSSLAQSLALTSLPVSGMQAAVVHQASISPFGESDVFAVHLSAGTSLTAETVSYLRGNYDPANPAVFDLRLRLLDRDGATLLAESDDISLGRTKYGPLESPDALLLNMPISAAGTYYLEVSDDGVDAGQYDLFLTVAGEPPHPWHNAALSLDVDNDGEIVPLDALIVINDLDAHGARALPVPPGVDGAPPFLDTDADDFVAPIDALLVINELDSPGLGPLPAGLTPDAPAIGVPEPSSAWLMLPGTICIAAALFRRAVRKDGRRWPAMAPCGITARAIPFRASGP